MVIKILELGILRELTEEEEESYKGGTPTESGNPSPVSEVPKVKDAGEPPTSHVILVPTLDDLLKPPVVSQTIETT
ncbi:hypothetical protein [uncultured Nostoc sp.]|uniref:hypothetical protein n=1 Tax=uncultured Nostoc sp. TaxID=340711 RepID=UPI0035CC6135